MSSQVWMRNGPRLTPGRVVRRAGEILRERGLRALVFLVLADLGYRRLLWLERVLSEPAPLLGDTPPLEFSRLASGDLDEYLAFHDEDPIEHLETRFARGDECFIARAEGRIVCANWAARGEHFVRFLLYPMRVGEGEVYVYDSYTLPAFRGKGAAPALAAHMLETFKHDGLARATTLVEPENAANLRARGKTGYRVCGRITLLKIGPRMWHWEQGGDRSPGAAA